jgi:hypothetical protein
MSFRDVHDEKSSPIFVFFVKLVESGNLPPKWRSSVTSKDEYDWLLLIQFRQLNVIALVELNQGKSGSLIAYMKMAGARPQP